MDSVSEFRNGKPYVRWNKDSVMVVAGQFNNMQDFRDAYIGAYKYATRNGFLEEVNELITGQRCPEVLLSMLERALNESARRFSQARRMRGIGERRAHGDDFAEEDNTGNHLDHDIGHWEQSAEEAEELALNYIERIKEFGDDDQTALSWDMFYTHQLNGRDGKRSRALTKVPR